MAKQNRLQIFEAYKTHPWLKKVYAKLKKDDLKIAHDFISKNDSLSKGDFEFAVNRMFLDKDRPKNYKEISELLSCTNSSLP